jgi:predicted extracellular nuclease
MLAAVLPIGATPALGAGPTVFINEIHYDNAGADAGEAIEIAGPAGTDLTGWSIVLYNGNGGTVYDTVSLTGVIPAQAGGFGTLRFDRAGIQNGAPDGIALVDAASSVIQFLSYEGAFTAVGGPANGQLSTDIGVAEASDSAVGNSLQLTGTGTMGGDFTWASSQPNTFGAVNTGQIFGTPTGGPALVVNEIDYDQPSTDTAEFVEIANVGTVAADLSQYTLAFINGSGGAVYASFALPAVTLSPGDYYVVCGDAANVENCDLDVSPDSNLIQNGAPDAVALIAGGSIVDTVSYEGDTAGHTEGSGVGLEDSSSAIDLGISRYPDGVDTNVNNVDLSQRCITPGEANTDASTGCEPPVMEMCSDPFTVIPAIQGSGSASPLVGTEVATEGVVVGDFQNNASTDNGNLNGFHIQDPVGDGDAATSDGLFVYAPGGIDVATGDAVRVRGTVSEFNGLTEVTASQIWICSTGNPLPAATSLSLPVTAVGDFESVEGMYVTFPQSLVISEYFNFDRFGEIVLTSQRNVTPTAEFEPGPDAVAAAGAFLLDRITLDDGRTNQNPDPALHPNGGVFDLTNLFRGGDTVRNVTGVMDYAFGLYRIQPTQGADYTNANPRTPAPDPVGGTLEVATFNVLNYFTTLDNSGPICGPLANQGCRGADNATEFTRQRDKIVAAISSIDADVVGLMEIENHPVDVPTADLVAGLNDATSPGTYDYIATGAIGGDAIRVALVYQPASVTPLGGFAVLDSSVDPLFDDTLNRPMLVQSFAENATGAVFTVAVNHLKSKGSGCNAVGDPDTGDGSGNCNVTRTNAAQAIVEFLAGDPTGSGDSDVLIIGDLNSYDKEDPIDVLVGAGYADLVFDFLGEDAYSYVFDGQIGYLDYQLASSTLVPQVTGTTVWHINADEPDLIDYDTSFKQPAQDAIYAPDAYRSSDHDPVVVGLELTTARSQKESALAELAGLLPTGSAMDDTFIEKAMGRIEDSLTPSLWTDASALDPETGGRVFDREHQAVRELEKVTTVDTQTAIDALLDADRQIALRQLSIAILGGGDPRRIAQARGNMADAAANLAAGDYANAVLDYKKAWTNALKAL